jgi:DNA-binding MarR family transcriptional regulator
MKFDVTQCIGNRLRCLSRIVDNEFRIMLKDFDITESQLSILFALSKLGKTEQRKIGDTLFLERSTVSRNIKLLENRGVVSRTASYRPEIEMTKQGELLLHQILPIWESLMTNLCDTLGEEGLSGLKTLEQKLK